MQDLIIILYVADQQISRDFYAYVLDAAPRLDVPGMTEFGLLPHLGLGLMPAAGIARLICPPCPSPSLAQGVPRCELYLRVDDPAVWQARAMAAGATHVRDLAPMDWHEEVAYVADPDGHVIAFARRQ